MEQQTPSLVMYRDLKAFGRISNIEAARILLSNKPLHRGFIPRDQAQNGPFLTRNVVRIPPDDVNPAYYADFLVTSPALASAIAGHMEGANPWATIADHYAGEACDQMQEALTAWGRNATLYANAVARVHTIQLSAADAATVLVLLFVAAGALGNPAKAVSLAEEFISTRLNKGFDTVLPEVCAEERVAETDSELLLGLVRIVDGKVRPQIHPLSTLPEGTTIGAFAMGPHDISDVDTDVSRQHLRIRRVTEGEDAGRWMVADLGSKNGSRIISGSDPQHAESPLGADEQPLLPNDILILGVSTRFLVLRIEG